MGPSVALVSAPRIKPSLKRQPTIVVPVLVAFGKFRPLSSRDLFLEKCHLCICIIYEPKTCLISFVKLNPDGLYIDIANQDQDA